MDAFRCGHCLARLGQTEAPRIDENKPATHEKYQRKDGTKMLLRNQVALLRENLVQLRTQKFTLPLWSNLFATKQAYQFKALVLPARDIATAIADADPNGSKLPARLRGWHLDITDEYEKPQRMDLKKLLGMIVHVYYLSANSGKPSRLDLSNDYGERIILPYDTFLTSVKRLVLTDEDICLVCCALTEENLKKDKVSTALMGMSPGPGDLLNCLATVNKWPKLQDSIWSRFFADNASPVASDCNTINDRPFLMGGRHVRTIKTIWWRIGWRRGDTYATSWIDTSQLIEQFRQYFGVERNV